MSCSNPSALMTLFALSVITCGCEAPEPAGREPDVWIVDLMTAGGFVAVGEPVNVTDRDEYDNQPAFTLDGRGLLYSSRRGNQVDVFRFDVYSGRTDRAALTLESEYSPVPLPGGDGYSVVRVERDGRQRVWRFPFDAGTPSPVTGTPEQVGYHAWVDDGTLLVQVLGDPATLWVLDLATGQARVLREGIGRSLQAAPGRRAVAYIRPADDGTPWIHEWDLDAESERPLAPALDGSEDFAWTADGRLLTGRGARLWVFDPEGSEGWVELADFSEDDVGEISRVAVSPLGDRVAFVAPEL